MRRGAWMAAVVTLALFGGVGVLASGQTLRVGMPAPEIANGRWINGEPLTIAALRGRVVLVEFWTYG